MSKSIIFCKEPAIVLTTNDIAFCSEPLFQPNDSMPIWAVKETLPVGLNIKWKTATLLRERIILIYPQNLGNIQELNEVDANRLTEGEKSESQLIE